MWVLAASCLAAPVAPPPVAPPPAAASNVQAPPPPAPSDPRVERAITWAEAALGTEYRWDGRGTDRLPGLDCLGVIFRAYGQATDTDWRRYPVNPSELVAGGLLGRPVPGLDGVLRSAVAVEDLRRGDVLYLLMREYLLKDEPLWVHPDESRYWPWHTGIYLGEGQVLNSHPGRGVVVMPLEELMFDGLFVTRLPPP
jgi:cell wall-associated NlpC family hydrolase